MRPARPGQSSAAMLACVIGAVLVVGCSSSGAPRESGRSTRVAFSGPLFLARPAGKHAAWAGAAGAVVQCTGRLGSSGTNAAPYSEGSVGHTPHGALQDASNVVSVAVPLLHLERRDTDRALYTSVYGGRVVQALVLRYGPAGQGTGPDEHGRGWWPESWAGCDLADWPETVSRSQGVEVWSDAGGARVDTRRVVSWVDRDGCLGEDTV